jgi:hypothetical protein
MIRMHLVASLGLSMLVGCSGSTTGTGGDLFGDGGTKPSLGGGGVGSGTGNGTGTGTGGQSPGSMTPGANPGSGGDTTSSCKLQNMQLTSDPCDQCIGKSCCTQAQGCDGNAACMAILNCVQQCAGDQTCDQQCAQQHQDGVPALKQVATCMQNSCTGVCQ